MNKSRNLVGYGQKDFKIEWPNKAKIAVQFVLNYEAVSYTHLRAHET